MKKPSLRRFSLFYLAILLALLLGLILIIRTLSDEAPRDRIVRQERALMGTSWLIQISLPADEPTFAARRDLQDVFFELSRIEKLMSEWKQESPVSAINAAAGGESVVVPEELRLLIERALAISEQTDGAFDISWRGMAHLWRFDSTFRVPTEEEIQAALEVVGFRKILVEGNRIGLPLQGMAIGLGGIAKGYAIDRAGTVLKEKGYRNFLINGGGDVLTAGSRGNRPWGIGVRAPRGSKNQLIALLNLRGGAVVTSGDYERFRMIDGIRYHHIIDPRTGWPARACRSVTIVAASAEAADAMATAVFVLGASKGLELVRQKAEMEAMVIDADGKYQMTPGFRQLAEFY
jgi:thiamine biosynthesis lipoprotein